MSFNSDLKNELCSASYVCRNCATAECLGLMLYAHRFSSDGIKIISENPLMRKHVSSLCRQVMGVQLISDGNALYLTEPEQLELAFSAFGYEYRRSALMLNRAFVEDDCCRAAFLRGILLSGGYASSPDKNYHLELVTPRLSVAQQTMNLLSEMGLAPGYIVRRGNHILYFKDSSVIEDVLTTAGAPNSAMEIMVKKVEKDLNNNINRKVNCDNANLDKTVAAAGKQIDAIKKLRDGDKWDKLPASLKETAELRLNNPLSSLSDLCKMHSGELSRPGLAARLRKLVNLSKESD